VRLKLSTTMFERNVKLTGLFLIIIGLVGSWLLFVRDADNRDATTFGGVLVIIGFILSAMSVFGLLAILIRGIRR
jgi:hypothetical protein